VVTADVPLSGTYTPEQPLVNNATSMIIATAMLAARPTARTSRSRHILIMAA
jgi:hypothetical protein